MTENTSTNIIASYGMPETQSKSEAVRLAMLFGLDQATEMDDLTLAQWVANGLPFKSFRIFTDLLIQVIGAQAKYAIVSDATMRRARERKSLTKNPSERMYDIGRVTDLAARVFGGDEGKFQRFLTRPNMMLEGQTPLDLAKSSSAGAEVVLKLLNQAEAGVAI